MEKTNNVVYVVVSSDLRLISHIHDQSHIKIEGVFSNREDADTYCKSNKIGKNMEVHSAILDKDVQYGIKNLAKNSRYWLKKSLK